MCKVGVGLTVASTNNLTTALFFFSKVDLILVNSFSTSASASLSIFSFNPSCSFSKFFNSSSFCFL